MKDFRKVLIFAPITGVIIGVCLILLFSGTVYLSLNGFAVDKDGLLYIGKENGIAVMDNGTLHHTVTVPTSRGYFFTITEGNTILLSDASIVYTMDLTGQILSRKEDVNAAIYTRLQFQSTYTAADGSVYILKRPMGRIQISHDQEVLYKMPSLDYGVALLLVLTSLATVVFGICIVVTRLRSMIAKSEKP